MTSLGPPLPVPDDDALDAAATAVADGVATPEEEAAVAAAPDGPARVAAFRAVAAAVRSPIGPQDPAAAAAALAAALAAFDDHDAGGAGEGTDDVGAGGGDAPAERRASVTSLPPASARPRSGRSLPRLAAVAAALVVLLGIGSLAVVALRAQQDSSSVSASRDFSGEEALRTTLAPGPAAAGTDARSAAAAAAEKAATMPPAAPVPTTIPAVPGPVSTPAPAPGPPAVDGGDLGRQDDMLALTRRIAAALDGVPDEALAAPNAALPRDVQACVTAGRTLANQPLGALRYRAVGDFRGTPAVFLAYDRGGAPPPYLLLVLARDRCTVLSSTSF